MKQQTLREVLRDDLSSRCAKNPKYSLRAFAKHLELDPAVLHRILSGDRKPSQQTVQKICRRLGFGPQETERFLNGKVLPPTSDFDFAPTKQELFNVISEWYHMPILELVALKDFEPRHEWIAEKLNISIHEVRAAVERLTSIGLLEITPKGKWVLSNRHNSFADDEYTSVARKKYQKAQLQNAINAIDTEEMGRRDNSGVTFAINSKVIPELIQMINNFRKKAAKFSEVNSDNADEVYQLSIALFPLTKKKTK